MPLTNPDIGVEEMGIAVLGYVGEGVRGALTLIALQPTIQGWLSRMGWRAASRGRAGASSEAGDAFIF